jgi:hypothetical protein
VLNDKLAEQGIHPTPEQSERAKDLIIQAEQSGLKHVPGSHLLEITEPDVIASHVSAFQVTSAGIAGIALLGVLFSLVLVRKADRVKVGVFSRRSRWISATSGRSPAVTRRPAPGPGESAVGQLPVSGAGTPSGAFSSSAIVTGMSRSSWR